MAMLIDHRRRFRRRLSAVLPVSRAMTSSSRLYMLLPLQRGAANFSTIAVVRQKAVC